MLNRATMTGPWAGLPVAWTADQRFAERAYRADVARCCRAGVPGVYTGGTTGEFYALEFDEFCAISRATVEECHAQGKPAMIGCTATYTLGAMRRAEFAARLGADAIQVALPFWMEIGAAEIVPFFQEVSLASAGLPLSIYETTRAKRTLTLEQHRAIHQAVPGYIMVKANAETLGSTPEGCAALAKFVNVFVGENLWPVLGPQGAKGACSSVVYWNPRLTLASWQEVERRNWPAVQRWGSRLTALFEFLEKQFGPRGFTDTAYDRLGGLASGFLQTSLHSRGPYPSPTPQDVEVLRLWYRENFPEMLEE